MTWAGGEPRAAERLTARGPLLVHFFEAGELAGVQALAQVDAWAQRYADAGLSTIGVHSPRSELARSPQAFAAAIERLGLGFPVVSDSDYRVWHAYGCKGWPSLFLWGRGGTLRWFHFGLPGLEETEGAIREELLAGREEDESAPRLPPPLTDPKREPQRVSKPSDEVFPGGAHDRAWTPEPGEPLEVEYAGAGAWATLDGAGEVQVGIDGDPARQAIPVSAPGLYELAEHGTHGVHEVRLEFEGEIRVWSVAFSPGPPGR